MCNWNFPIKVMSCSGNWNKLFPPFRIHLLPFSQSKASRWQTSPNREMKRATPTLLVAKCWNSFQFIKWHWLPNDWSLVLIFTSFHLIWKSVKNIYGNNLFCCSTYIVVWERRVINDNDTKTVEMFEYITPICSNISKLSIFRFSFEQSYFLWKHKCKWDF